MGGKANMRAHQALRSGYPQTQVTRLLSPTPREKAVAEIVGWLVFSIPVLGCSGFNERQININTIFYCFDLLCSLSITVTAGSLEMENIFLPQCS